MEKVFKRFDEDGSESIDKIEFVVGLRTLGIEITNKEADSLWPMFDYDGDGLISWNEFLQSCK